MGHGYRVADEARTVMAFPYEGLPAFSSYASEAEARNEHAEAWQVFTETLLDCLPPAWKPDRDRPWRRGHPGGLVLAASGLHELLLEEGRGGYGYAYVSGVPHAGLEPSWDRPCPCWNLARARLDVTAAAIFDRLAGRTETRVPNGYVSAPYSPSRAAPARRIAA